MGAWGSGPFDNDAAGDWLCELEDNGVEAIDDALETYEQGDPGEIDNWEECTILAIGEIVAARFGQRSSEFHDDYAEWYSDEQITRDHLARVLMAVRKVRDDSDLRDLWMNAAKEESDAAEWLAKTDDLIRRLEAASSG